MIQQRAASEVRQGPGSAATTSDASAQPTVYVVDDDFSICRALRHLLSSVGLNVATFSSAAEFLAAYNSRDSGCLILDVRMPGMSGLELQRTLKQRRIFLPVIMVTGYGDVATAVRAMKDGAVDFLEKPFSEQLLLEHVQAALARDQRQRAQRDTHAQLESRLALLSGREREVMEGVVAGKANKEIAAELGLSKKTIEVHRAHVMHKLKVDTLPELVSLVIATRMRDDGEAATAARAPLASHVARPDAARTAPLRS